MYTMFDYLPSFSMYFSIFSPGCFWSLSHWAVLRSRLYRLILGDALVPCIRRLSPQYMRQSKIRYDHPSWRTHKWENQILDFSHRMVPIFSFGHMTTTFTCRECCRNEIACVAADSFPFSGGAEIEQANEKRASEGARLGWAKKLGRSREGVSKKGEGVGRKGTACL